MAKRKIKKGDAVVVIAGEHKGSEVHKVVAIDTAKNRATIEGVTVKKHSRPSSKHPQ